jgi:hypothetical protein
MLTELELDHLFWKAVSSNKEFRDWLLSRSKFAGRSLELKTDELWHQRWYKDPDTKEESETDITLIFMESGSGHLFAIHIENKTSHRAWENNQAENYPKRAADRMVKWKHADWEVALLAPRDHIENHLSEAKHFGFQLTYEDVGAYVPEFMDACL